MTDLVCVTCTQQPCRCAPPSTSCAPSREHAWRSVLHAVVEDMPIDEHHALQEGLSKRAVHGQSGTTALVDALLPLVMRGERMMNG